MMMTMIGVGLYASQLRNGAASGYAISNVHPNGSKRQAQSGGSSLTRFSVCSVRPRLSGTMNCRTRFDRLVRGAGAEGAMNSTPDMNTPAGLSCAGHAGTCKCETGLPSVSSESPCFRFTCRASYGLGMLVIPVCLLVLEIIVFGKGVAGSDSDDDKSLHNDLSISSSRRSPTICLTLNFSVLVRLLKGVCNVGVGRM